MMKTSNEIYLNRINLLLSSAVSTQCTEFINPGLGLTIHNSRIKACDHDQMILLTSSLYSLLEIYCVQSARSSQLADIHCSLPDNNCSQS